MLDEYRQRASSLVSDLRIAEYNFLCGVSPAYEEESILREQSDLFSRDAINSLQHHSEGLAIDSTPYRAISHLIEFAKWGYLVLAASDISRDIRSLTTSTGSSDVQDLLFKRESILDSAARKLGAKSHRELLENKFHIDLAESLRECEALIEELQSRSQPAERNASLPGNTVTADLAGIYHGLCSGLGFDSTKQKNVTLDVTFSRAKRKRAFCALPDVPNDIRIVLNPTGDFYKDARHLLGQAGCAQHGAWTSQHLQPELRQYGDPALVEAWKYLVGSVQSEPRWLDGVLSPSAASHACREAQETDSGERLRDAQTVVAIFGKGIELEKALRAISRLRGRAFANHLKEHLRTRFGTRWWASRKTGEMLIDLWNTGYRYTLDELASMIGIGKVFLT